MFIYELKKGNYVVLNGDVVTVVDIDIASAKVVVETREGRTLAADKAAILPIKLSYKLLTNCCSFDSSATYVLDVNSQVYAIKFVRKHIIMLDSKLQPVIHFWDVTTLHQLQNLYYSLKRTALDISLSCRVAIKQHHF